MVEMPFERRIFDSLILCTSTLLNPDRSIQVISISYLFLVTDGGWLRAAAGGASNAGVLLRQPDAVPRLFGMQRMAYTPPGLGTLEERETGAANGDGIPGTGNRTQGSSGAKKDGEFQTRGFV